MTEADRKPFGMMITAMAAAYRKAGEVDEPCLAGYWLLLADLELPAISAAMTQAARASKFMPTAAEIRELVLEQIEHQRRRVNQEQRRREFAMSTAIAIVKDALFYGKDEAYMRSELVRVGRNMNLELPWPQAFIDEQPPKEASDVV